jgi:hypothetical protein
MTTNPIGELMTTTDQPMYGIWIEGDRAAAELWPRTAEGAITAITRACRYSRRGAPVEVRRPDGTVLAQYKAGRRADLPDGGIAHMADARASLQ